MLDVQAVRRFMVKQQASAMTAEGNMVDDDVDAADALARLEAALDRIAEGSRPAPGPQAEHGSDPGAAQGGAQIAERLDALIAQLRDALDREAPDRDAPDRDPSDRDTLASGV